jgi:hypothetical protein
LKSLKLKINNIDLLRLCIVLTFLTPIFLLSNYIAGSLFRDNIVYNKAYLALSNHNNILDNYALFLVQSGASEPLSFLFFLSGSLLSLQYSGVILIKNIIFIMVTSLVSIKFFKNNLIFLIFCVYISTDYYILRLMSELHRINLAVLVILISLLYFRSIIIPILLATLFHLQAIFFIFFCKIKPFDLIKIFLILCPLIIFVLPSIISKLRVYQTFDLFSFIKILIIGTLFLITSRYWPKDIFYRLTIGLLAIGFFSIFFGSDRLLFVIWELFIFILFYAYNNSIMRKTYFKYFFLLLMIFLIPYNIYRITLFISEFLDAGII